jgi:hypothetical protein
MDLRARCCMRMVRGSQLARDLTHKTFCMPLWTRTCPKATSVARTTEKCWSEIEGTSRDASCCTARPAALGGLPGCRWSGLIPRKHAPLFVVPTTSLLWFGSTLVGALTMGQGNVGALGDDPWLRCKSVT